MIATLTYLAAWLLLTFGVGFACFICGAVYENLRKGGTRDLEARLRTVTRLQPVKSTPPKPRLPKVPRAQRASVRGGERW